MDNIGGTGGSKLKIGSVFSVFDGNLVSIPVYKNPYIIGLQKLCKFFKKTLVFTRKSCAASGKKNGKGCLNPQTGAGT